MRWTSIRAKCPAACSSALALPRAIALKPKMLLLDEPFGRLDSLTRMELQDVILGILDREKTGHDGDYARSRRSRLHV